MHEKMIAEWNARVAPGDTVWLLGDIIMGPVDMGQRIISSLHGTKNLILGNHDGTRTRAARIGYNAVLYREDLVFGPYRMTLTHKPEAPMDGWFNIHGHTHSRERIRGRQINVGVEAWGYGPASLEWINRLMFQDVVTPEPVARPTQSAGPRG